MSDSIIGALRAYLDELERSHRIAPDALTTFRSAVSNLTQLRLLDESQAGILLRRAQASESEELSEPYTASFLATHSSSRQDISGRSRLPSDQQQADSSASDANNTSAEARLEGTHGFTRPLFVVPVNRFLEGVGLVILSVEVWPESTTLRASGTRDDCRALQWQAWDDRGNLFTSRPDSGHLAFARWLQEWSFSPSVGAGAADLTFAAFRGPTELERFSLSLTRHTGPDSA